MLFVILFALSNAEIFFVGGNERKYFIYLDRCIMYGGRQPALCLKSDSSHVTCKVYSTYKDCTLNNPPLKSTTLEATFSNGEELANYDMYEYWYVQEGCKDLDIIGVGLSNCAPYNSTHWTRMERNGESVDVHFYGEKECKNSLETITDYARIDECITSGGVPIRYVVNGTTPLKIHAIGLLSIFIVLNLLFW